MLPDVTRLHAIPLVAMLLAACSSDSATSAKNDSGQTTKENGQATKVSGPETAPDGTKLGQLRTSEHIDLNLLVNKTPAEVEAVLGPAQETGSDRLSCVRFVPERVFFSCEQEIRVWRRPPFEAVRIEFEDGRAANVSLSGLPGEGSFDVDAALASVGVSLPEAPAHDNPPLGVGGEPEAVVDRWEWSNDRARLRVDGLEHRVRVSVVDSLWSRAKIEIINNHPLDPGQAARIKPVKGAAPGEPSSPASESASADQPPN
jgi:hypothetical protein